MRASTKLFLLVALFVLPGYLTAATANRGGAQLNGPSGQVSSTSPTFTWSAVDGAERYLLWVNHAFGVEVARWINAADANCQGGTCAIASPTVFGPGSYRWWVQAVRGGGNGIWSAPREFAVSRNGLGGRGRGGRGAPDAFTPLAPSGTINSTQPAFEWSESPRARFYVLRVRQQNGRDVFRGAYPAVAICEQGTCSVDAMISNISLQDGRYTWWVRAQGFRRAQRSARMDFQVQGAVRPPRRPRLLEPRGRVSQLPVLFSWNASERATQYELQVNDRGQTIFSEVFDANDALCQQGICSVAPDTLVLQAGRYQYLVRAMNSAGASRWSRANFRLVDPPLATPTPVEPTGTATATPTFVWKGDPRTEVYILQVRDAADAQVIRQRLAAADVCVNDMCSYTSGQQLAAGDYAWRIRARSGRNRTRWSDFLEFKVDPNQNQPPGPTIGRAPVGTITVNAPNCQWDDVSAASIYHLFLYQNQNGTDVLIFSQTVLRADASCDPQTGLCSLQPQLSQPLADGDYSFQVQTENAAGRGPLSDRVLFTVDTSQNTPPAKMVGRMPTGTININNLPFVWDDVLNAVTFHLTVNRIDNGASVVHHQQSFLRVDSNCDPATGQCTVQPQFQAPLPDGDYNFVVQGENAAGRGDASDPLAFTVDTSQNTPPVQMVGRMPTGTINNNNPMFVWDDVGNAVTFHLTVNRIENGAPVVHHQQSFLRVDSSCDPTAGQCTVQPTLPAPLAEGDYNFVVQGENAAGRGVASAPLAFTVDTSQNTPPVQMVGRMPTGTIINNNPPFVWDDVGNAVTFHLTINRIENGAPVVHHQQSFLRVDSSCDPTTGQCTVQPTLPTPLADSDYNFVVQGENAAGRGVASAPVAFKVDTSQNTPPGATTLVAPTGTITVNNPFYTWTDVPAATRYHLFVRQNQNGNIVDIIATVFERAQANCGVQTAGQCSVQPQTQSAPEDGDYFFEVQTENAAGLGALSAPLPFTIDTSQNTPPGATMLVAPTGIVNVANPVFSWTDVRGATTYILTVFDNQQANAFGPQAFLSADAGCDGQNCAVQPVSLPNGDYTFTVQTSNAAGNGPTAGPLGFTISTGNSTLVQVTSHNNGESAPDNGFLVSGTVDASIASLQVALDVNGQNIMPLRAAEISANNRFTINVLPGQLATGAATLTFQGTDGQGGVHTTSLNLDITPADLRAAMLLERATFGATPELLEEVRTSGTQAFLNRLLNPVADPNFDAFVASLPTTNQTETRQYAMLHALFNPNPLQEVMAQFWDNHFSTDMDSHDVEAFEINENNLFRANALGRFRNLLEMSAKSPAMLIYLDLTNSTGQDPNENFAREILELHTVSVDGPYTQNDIEQLSLILTGWKEVNGQFVFDINDHDTGPKSLSFGGINFPGTTDPAAALDEGHQVLDMLSAHPDTAGFICRKLIELFVSEQNIPSLESSCAGVFLAEHNNGNPNQMREVVAHILSAAEFADPVNFRAKVKTPLEYLTSSIRAISANVVDAGDLEGELRTLGMTLFENSTPDGFSEEADDWIDTSLMLDRLNFINEIVREAPGRETWVDLRQYFIDRGYETAEGIAGYLFQIAFQNDYTALELNLAVDILTAGGTSAFDINGADAEARLQKLVGTLFTFPGYMHQ